CNVATSPSGYACDPWSVHLYLAWAIKRQGSSLRLILVHNADNEGSQNDMTIPPEHDFGQTLTVDVPLTSAVKDFLCVVFTAQANPSSFDSSSPSFLSSLAYSHNTLLYSDEFGSASAANLIDICGGSTIPALVATNLGGGLPAMPDVALMIPLNPKPTTFTP